MDPRRPSSGWLCSGRLQVAARTRHARPGVTALALAAAQAPLIAGFPAQAGASAVGCGLRGCTPRIAPAHHDPRLRIPRITLDGEASRPVPSAASTVAARAPASFYVDALAGSNANPGTSPGAPWRTLAQVNRGSYRGGERILLHAGERFEGTLRFRPANLTATSRRSPLTLSSYGGETATLAGGSGSGIVSENVAGLHITGLQVAGEGRACRRQTFGILFFAEHARRTLAEGITIDHVDVHDFCTGIGVGTGDDGSRFEHVSISDLAAHDNGDAGVFTFDPALKHHDIHDVHVSGVQAYNNDGTGGIALFGVDGGTVEHSVAHDNGRLTDGSVGIWAFDATGITIAHSESYRNRTIAGDGDGFDLDGGVSHSVMQYDYAHDNEGMGYLVCACVGFYAMHENVVRYDVSQNDGTNGQPSGLYVLGGEPFSGLEVFNNSFYSAAGPGPVVLLEGGGHRFSSLHLRNNLLASGTGKPLLEFFEPSEAAGLAIQGNDWWPGEGAFHVEWGKSSFGSLAEFRERTGMERLGHAPVGQSSPPEVCALGQGATLFPLEPGQLRAYELRSGSPLIDAGLDLAGLFGTDVGTRDFGGDRTPRGAGLDIGADERQPAEGC